VSHARRDTRGTDPASRLLECENPAMTSTDEDVGALHRQGLSIRAIAERLGLSRSAVHRRVSRLAEAEADEYDDEGDENAAPYDDYEPVPPFAFVGLAVAEDRRGNPLKDGNGRPFGLAPRAVDGRGVSVPNPELDMWRWCAHARAEGDYEGADAVEADWARQLAAAGVRCDDRGRWFWAESG
jgi:hypothetical protein